MFGLGHWELLIILIVVMIIFGAGKLPQIGTGIGQSIRNFKKGVAEVEAEIKRERSGTSIELLVNFCYET